MKGTVGLALAHARHHAVTTAVLVLALACTLFLPWASRLLSDRWQRDLASRSQSTPLVAGTRGNRFDLTLKALYFRPSELEPVPYRTVREIADTGLALAVPLQVRHTARKRPIVATSPEYYEVRRLRTVRGTIPLDLGDCTLGARVAEELELDVGDALFSDPTDLYDISRPAALKMHVRGVLAPTGTADDHAVFVDVRTAWILEGAAHGHDDVVRQVDEGMVLGRTEDNVTMSSALIEYNEVTPQNAASFHYHGDEGALPLSAVLVFPDSAKSQTLLKARFNTSKTQQMVVAEEVVDDLLSFVFRVKDLLDGIALLLATCTVLLAGLVIVLSLRLRRDERWTLHRMGVSRSRVFALFGVELFAIAGLGVALAAGGTFVALRFLHDLVAML